jgi:hypothetical protein
MWMAVVPKQECTAASLDVDDTGPAIAKLSSMGYRRVGTIHTHPGNGVGCSGTDQEDLWTDFGGVHLIIGRTRGAVGVYYTMRGHTFRIERGKKSAWAYPELFAESKVNDGAFIRKEGAKYSGRILPEEGKTLTAMVEAVTWVSTKTTTTTHYVKPTRTLSVRQQKALREGRRKKREIEGQKNGTRPDWMSAAGELIAANRGCVEPDDWRSIHWRNGQSSTIVKVYTTNGITYGEDITGDSYIWNGMTEEWDEEFPSGKTRFSWEEMTQKYDRELNNLTISQVFHLVSGLKRLPYDEANKALEVLRLRAFGVSNAYLRYTEHLTHMIDIRESLNRWNNSLSVVKSIGEALEEGTRGIDEFCVIKSIPELSPKE